MTGKQAWEILWGKIKDHAIASPQQPGIVRVPYGFKNDLAKLSAEEINKYGVPQALAQRIANNNWDALNEFLNEHMIRIEDVEIEENDIEVVPDLG